MSSDPGIKWMRTQFREAEAAVARAVAHRYYGEQQAEVEERSYAVTCLYYATLHSGFSTEVTLAEFVLFRVERFHETVQTGLYDEGQGKEDDEQ